MKDLKAKPESSILATLSDTSGATLTITASTRQGKKEIRYPITEPTGTIVGRLTEEIGMPPSGPFKRQVTDQIEIAKAYDSEAEYRITWDSNFRISIKRSPNNTRKTASLPATNLEKHPQTYSGLYLGLI